MTWVDQLGVPIAAGILSSGVVAATPSVHRAIRERQGELSGWWLQLTYDHMDLALTGPIWSIEVVHARHRGTDVRGTMWRLYPYHHERQWTFTATFRAPTLRGLYDEVRGDGGEGLLHLHRTAQGMYGQYLLTVAQMTLDRSVSLSRGENSLEWLRLGACTGDKWRRYLDDYPGDLARAYLPRAVQRAVFGRRWARPGWLAWGGASAAALLTTSQLSALLQATGDHDEERESLIAWYRTQLRRVDIVGEQAIHPAMDDRGEEAA